MIVVGNLSSPLASSCSSSTSCSKTTRNAVSLASRSGPELRRVREAGQPQPASLEPKRGPTVQRAESIPPCPSSRLRAVRFFAANAFRRSDPSPPPRSSRSRRRSQVSFNTWLPPKCIRVCRSPPRCQRPHLTCSLRRHRLRSPVESKHPGAVPPAHSSQGVRVRHSEAWISGTSEAGCRSPRRPPAT